MPYVPPEVTVEFVTQKQKLHPRYGEITHIILSKKPNDVNAVCVFHDFGNKFTGSYKPHENRK